uniref:Cadherin domain-containing protein n=1 Tax=Knipowitschia caucasica TaxID=637954 RepID=A0AAV2J747_KNICA
MCCRVHPDTGHICTSAPLDRDQGPAWHQLSLTAADGGGLSSVTSVRVDVEDVNDNAPSFYPLVYAVSLSSQSAPGTSVLRVTARDPDSGDYGRVTYRTVPGGNSPYFTLNKDTGVISLSRSVYGKANSVVSMAISAQDGGGLVAPVQARVDVSVVAGSVAPPVFQQAHYHFSVSEGALRGTLLGAVQASVRTGSSEDVSYSISSGDPTGLFTVDPESGSLRTNRSLDHEVLPTLDLEVQARSGSPPAFGQTRIHVTVTDVNDNPPTFVPSSSESLLLPEHTGVGAVVYRVLAEDLDSGANGQMAFELKSAMNTQRTFSLDRGTGEIRLVGSLSFENVPRYDLQVVAKDNGVPPLSATFTLLVHVQAPNDHGPVFDTVTYRVELREGTPPNTRFLQVRAMTRDHTSVKYRLRADADAHGFAIAADSGWLFVKSTIDREAKDMYVLTVTASEADGQKTGSATVRISVTDENDNSPKFSQDRVFLAVRENLPAGTGFGHVAATDRDAGANGRVSYRLMHPERMFQINPHTGELSTRWSLDREQQSSYQLLLLVQDGGSPSLSATATAFITVTDQNDHAPSFITVMDQNNHVPSFTHNQSENSLVIQVPEGPAGALLSTLQAKDPDEGENGTISFSLSDPNMVQTDCRYGSDPNMLQTDCRYGSDPNMLQTDCRYGSDPNMLQTDCRYGSDPNMLQTDCRYGSDPNMLQTDCRYGSDPNMLQTDCRYGSDPNMLQTDCRYGSDPNMLQTDCRYGSDPNMLQTDCRYGSDPNMLQTDCRYGSDPNMLQTDCRYGSDPNMLQTDCRYGSDPNMLQTDCRYGSDPNMLQTDCRYGSDPNMLQTDCRYMYGSDPISRTLDLSTQRFRIRKLY